LRESFVYKLYLIGKLNDRTNIKMIQGLCVNFL
jgi:hypothetical protein